MVRRLSFIVLIVFVAISMLGLTGQIPVYALQAAPGPLGQLLGQVPDNQVSRTIVWYGSLSDLGRVLGFQIKTADDVKKLPRQQQLAYLLDVSGKQVYYSSFSGLDHPAEWKQVFALDSYSIERELTVGADPNWYAILEGQFSSGAITKALQTLGYKPSQIGSATVYSLGSDNAAPGGPAGQLADDRYNRLVVTDQKITAAPSNALIQAAISGGKFLGSDPAYSSLVGALEGQNTIPDTQLTSAALFDTKYLNTTLIGSDDAGLQGSKPLARYQAAGVGYRRGVKARYWMIALVYGDANSANQAGQMLTARLAEYVSSRQGGRQLFQGWPIKSSVVPSDNGLQVAIVTMQLPSQTDVAWTDLITTHDLGFLVTK
jgi:hypothetical protein